MTGYGEARLQTDSWTASVEVRTVNNRHLKLSARISDPYGALEPELERLVREHIRRGTVQLNLRVERPRRAEDYRLNVVALRSYRDQLAALSESGSEPVSLSQLLALPGVVEERRRDQDDPHEDWPKLAEAVTQALLAHQKSRAEEGRAMGEELLSLGRVISEHLEKIAAMGTEIVSAYAKRLHDRVQNLITEKGIALEPKDLIREVAIFAERSDIAEEITRLRAHLIQFVAVINEPESAGRKLEFVVQEMGRETNTIGSKANDVAISQAVVEIKGALEKIRELIQNVE